MTVVVGSSSISKTLDLDQQFDIYLQVIDYKVLSPMMATLLNSSIKQ